MIVSLILLSMTLGGLLVYQSRKIKALNAVKAHQTLIQTTYLETLSEVSQIVVTNYQPITEKLHVILVALKSKLPFRAYSVFELDEFSQTLHLRTAEGLSNWYMQTLQHKIKVKVGDVCIGRAVATKRPAAISDCFTDPRLTRLLPFAIEGRFKGLLAVPLIGKAGKIYGSLCTYSGDVHDFTAQEIQFFTIVADSITLSIESSFRQTQLKEHNSTDVLISFKQSW